MPDFIVIRCPLQDVCLVVYSPNFETDSLTSPFVFISATGTAQNANFLKVFAGMGTHGVPGGGLSLRP